MAIVIFHYHLNPGGVTRVVESQVEALSEIGPEIEIKVITGGCDDSSVFKKNNIELIVNPEINYLTDKSNLEEKYQQVYSFIHRNVQKDDLLLFHNLNLGKNPLVTLAVYRLATLGYNVLNQAHDFSEDREVNHAFLEEIISGVFKEDLKQVMYPQLDNYQYATLNSFDLNRLFIHGIDKSRCTMLPNPVVFSAKSNNSGFAEWRKDICNELKLDVKKKIVVYPVRVIRRKNIGEFILLATLLSSEANWLVTQPPKNPVEIVPYNKWKDFCANENINIIWESGTKVDFEQLVTVANFCVSTSIQEGFGMVYMEPWLLGTPVVGRNIEMVTKDMIDTGMKFSCLYDSLYVKPGVQLHELSQEEQMEIIAEVKNNRENAETILENNPFIKKMLIKVDKELMSKNKKVILTDYSLSNYGEKLNGVYRRIIK